MPDKYYRVKKDNFLWKEGAIIKCSPNEDGYRPLEDIWNNTPVQNTEYITAKIIEHHNNSEYFERVYPDTISGKLFKTKDQLIEIYQTSFIK